MLVHNLETGRAEEELVHGALASLLVDHIARIKCSGHAGVKSEANFCLYCKIRQCYLSVPEGFIPEGNSS